MAIAPANIKDSTRLRFALAAYALSFIPNAVLPWTIAALVDRKLTLAQAGELASIQLGVLALFAIGGSFFAHALNKVRTLALCAGVMVIASLLATATESLTALTLLVAAIAAGAGMASAIGSAVLASADNSDRMTAHLWTGSLIWQAVLWQATPRIVAQFGITGLHLEIAAASAALMILFPGYVDRAPRPAGRESAATEDGGRRLSWLVSAPILIAAFAFWFRDALAWSLTEQRATMLGVSGSQMAATLGAACLLGLPAPALAGWAGRSFGKVAPLIIGVIAIALVVSGIAAAGSGPVYRGFYTFWTFASIFAWTFLLQIAVSADASGRLAGLAGSMVFVGGALGPVAAGLLMTGRSTQYLSAAVGLLGLATLLCALWIAWSTRRLASSEHSSHGHGATMADTDSVKRLPR